MTIRYIEDYGWSPLGMGDVRVDMNSLQIVVYVYPVLYSAEDALLGIQQVQQIVVIDTIDDFTAEAINSVVSDFTSGTSFVGGFDVFRSAATEEE
jgi:hypothetical protein